ncbi:hypothetical protein EMPS_10162 [Entomortierella parvispora]|uniref:C2H2-type domain-containing protein n=1 Tax=Entomortierella parvispora TaxID=205924 RepID=A0A9P3HJR8_9FUNG|nr:hypothetical protein EMPS_10162 [Entomortierella parvispora]
MSTASILPPITAAPYLGPHIERPPRVSSQPHPSSSSSSPSSSSSSSSAMQNSEADSTLQQQSKRLAGLSITNSTGAKVSILNDSITDLSSVTRQDKSSSSQQPTSPSESRPAAQYRSHSYNSQHSFQDHHHHSSNADSGRSSSLTNASTPIYSSQDLKEAAAAAGSGGGPGGPISSLRSRSLSGGANKLSPLMTNIRNGAVDQGQASASSSTASPTFPYFARSYSEDNSSDDADSSFRRMSDNGVNFVKRKYSCSYPGCNKCFTTSGHLARHNRIHTGERNFACLMPGCPSKFSRQDNMMQHYRTHISPKSRRGMPKKQDYFTMLMANGSQEALREQSPAAMAGATGDQQQHHHVAKMSSSRQGSRHNSPPRFNPFDRSSSVDYTGRNSTEGNSGSGGSLRHRHSGIIQAHQHHTPLPHFSIQSPSVSSASTSSSSSSSQGALPSPLTPSMASGPLASPHPPPAYVPVADLPALARYTVQQAAAAAKSSNSNGNVSNVSSNGITYRSSDGSLASPTSPQTQDVERMEGVASTAEYHNSYRHHSQQPYQSQAQQQPSGYQGSPYGGSRHSHAGHASSQQQHHHHHHQHPQQHPQQQHQYHHQGYQLPPLSLHGQDRHDVERLPAMGHRHGGAPPSPQSTPHTPTKYRFDPIQDCLQQDKMHHQHHHHTQQQQQQQQRQYEQYGRYPQEGYYSKQQHPQHPQGHADEEDNKMLASTTRSSVMSTGSSMTSMSSGSSNSINGHSSRDRAVPHHDDPRENRGSGEELSGLAHLAQIVTTFG